MIAVALATLATVLWLLIRARINEQSVPLLAQLFTLNVGVLVIAAILAFFDRSPTTGGRISGVAALIFVGAFVWDLVTSGRATNSSSKRFPRHVRVYLYLGYTLLLTTLVVLLAAVSFNSPEPPRSITAGFNQTQYAPLWLAGAWLRHALCHVHPACQPRSHAATATTSSSVSGVPSLSAKPGVCAHSAAALPESAVSAATPYPPSQR